MRGRRARQLVCPARDLNTRQAGRADGFSDQHAGLIARVEAVRYRKFLLMCIKLLRSSTLDHRGVVGILSISHEMLLS